MESIEQSIYGNSYLADSNDKKNGMQHKNAWLSVMEKSGLLDALRQTRLIELGGAPIFGSAGDYCQQIGENIIRSSVLEDFPRQNNEKSPDTSPEKVNIGSGELANMQLAASQKISPVLTGYFLREINSQQTVEKLNSLKFLHLPTHFRGYGEWALINIIALNSKAGVDIWIRSAELSDNAKIQHFLKVLRENMGNLGATLVMVNGKKVFGK